MAATSDTTPLSPDALPVKRPVLARSLTLRYLGFENTGQGRNYHLRVDSGSDVARLYDVSIPTEAFASRLVRFQDAAELCLQRLHRELDANAELPGGASFVITTADLDLYREAQQRSSPTRKSRTPHPAR